MQSVCHHLYKLFSSFVSHLLMYVPFLFVRPLNNHLLIVHHKKTSQNHSNGKSFDKTECGYKRNSPYVHLYIIKNLYYLNMKRSEERRVGKECNRLIARNYW